MGIPTNAKPAIVICARERDRSTAFYRDALGLELASEDRFAATFTLGDATLRVSLVPDFTPHGHTILGFVVPDVPAAVLALAKSGVAFERFPAFKQDERGILTLPDGKGQVAWFKDPAGNLLSVTNT
jgi:catechol 2,3-dioxygenase-like lactoylglutathione lyase family enzyme